ncbi:hypothetical protein H6F93_18720 [Leptolyngbya sp. FACHB-671]|uniref:hypothetical protein n=1 Tax=Leptolyngbya sp. FACHB-671 TaxID=2692812 RepID=UPI0016878D0B|nr:hypothetical protein [Leptolyngbya sp. FACHB-671]MBD2069532.1 hypothetical protein [Leptolyngbya sp. FACHB-671]
MRYIHLTLAQPYLRRILLIPGLSIVLFVSGLLVISPAQASFRQAWSDFWEGNGRRTPPVPYGRGGGRDPHEPCPIAPFALPEVAMVWSDRPTFVWDGEVEKIAVRRANSDNEIWNAAATGLTHVTYTGEALQPNITYQWLIFTSDFGNQPQRIISFQVIPSQERNLLAQQLPEMQQDEAIAIERAYHFAQQELWSDFWREVLAVEQPSSKLSELIDQTVTAVCEEN